MNNVQQIPLAERLQGAGPRSMGLPVAMGLYAEDFLGLVGQMTGQQDRYAEVYATQIKPYEGEDDGKSVRNMVVAADALPPAEKTTLLFRLLVEPFAALEYKDLFDSIKANGINEPVKARPREGGGLELLSGHRRHDVAKQLGYPVPVVIVQMDDDSARIEVVVGNLHRQDIPTSELARAAKMKMEALARKAGRRSKMDQLTGPSKRTDQIVAEDMGMSRNQVNRLVRIDSLVPELKQQVDEKKLPFNTAVELSFLKPEEQGKVVDFIKKEQMVPSLVQATQLKEASRAAQAAEKEAEKAASKASPSTPPSTEVKAQDKAEKKAPAPAPAPVDEKKIAAIVKPKTEPEQKYTFTSTELREYFPGDRLPSVSEVKRKVFDALDLHKRALERKQAKEALKESMKKGPER